ADSRRGASVTGVRTCALPIYEWLPGGFFMAHHWDVKQGATVIKGMEVIGYDAKAKVYTSTFFDNGGNTGVFKGTVQGSVWTWTRSEERREGKRVDSDGGGSKR